MTPSRVITSVRRTARAAAGILVDNFCPFWGLGCPKRGLKNGDTIVIQLIANEGGKDIIITLSNYISTVAESQEGVAVLKLIADNVNKEIGVEVMTIAEQIKQEAFIEGRAKGLLEGKAEGKAEGEALMLIRLLTLKFGFIPKNYLECIQQADAEILLSWGEKVLHAKTIDEIFIENK